MTENSQNKKPKQIVSYTPPKSALAKLAEVPMHVQTEIELTIHKANIRGRIKMAEADLIVKHGLLRKKK
ncbi:MAG: hypothetical protein M5U34_31460 [Chloroflexi bacterium]|nr:hypothetical protein [Chloroflexota bacterium]